MNDRYPDVGKENGLLGYLAKQEAACREAAETGQTQLTVHGGPDKGHAHQLDRFIDEINGDGPAVCPVDDAVLATRVAFAAIQSAKQHRPVKLSEL